MPYIILMRSRRNGDQILRLGTTLYGKRKAERFLDYYMDATSAKKYTYLLIDTTANGKQEHEIRSGGILPGTYPIIYPPLK